MKTLKNTIEANLNMSIELTPANDGANLLYTASVNGKTVANVYKSFDKNFGKTEVIRYVVIN